MLKFKSHMAAALIRIARAGQGKPGAAVFNRLNEGFG